MKKENTYKCLCCNTIRYINEIKHTISAIENFEKTDTLWYYENLNLLERYPLKDFHWACDHCLKNKKAILANPINQQYVDYRPYLAYYDTSKECRSCNTDFIFKATEKRYWFEELKFWVQSDAIKCLDCRKSDRLLKELSNILSKGENNLSHEELNRTIELYKILGKVEKEKYFISKKKNKAK